MGEVRRIVDQLHRAYTGPAWHGPALGEILGDLTFQAAAARPIADAHTIWELVLHVTVWMNVVRRRVEGEVLPTLTPAEDWPAPPEASEAAWRKTAGELDEAQTSLEAAIRNLTDERLRETVLGEVPYSIYTMLHGAVQHNLYHAGQMALLKKAAHASQ